MMKKQKEDCVKTKITVLLHLFNQQKTSKQQLKTPRL